MAPRQADRKFEVTSPLGTDKLLFRSMAAREWLSRPYEYDLVLLSEDMDIKFEDVLGQNLTVRYDLVDADHTRYFNGFVSEFHFQGTSGRFAVYRARLRPWLWFLTRTADCRIFQEKSLPDIIKQIFDEHGFSDYEDKLSGEHEPWIYCVQYRETDFDFVNRLMEHEGIYYYFVHENGKHKLVLADSIDAPEPAPGYEEVPYYPPDPHEMRERDHLWDWSVRKEVQPGKVVHTDYNFEKPRMDLETRLSQAFEHDHASYEVYDYPGAYLEPKAGDNTTLLRMEEWRSRHERVEGAGDAGGLAAGAQFELIQYPRDDQNRKYLIVSAEIELSSDAYETGGGAGESECRCAIAALDAETPFRPPRITPKSIVRGPQTAVVVGPAGEEIHTDEHGRVKVQFHWDREGKNDENSSCWIRVSHPWAGKNWGAIAIPRIGQEVIVDFLEGDPDQPIITGRVYNGEAVPPYGLPDNKTQTGIKSRSSKDGGGDNFNEIRFEDKKGEEQVYIHAEKNQDNVVENDETTSVGHDRTETVGNDETITIHGNRTETVDKDETITIHQNRTETVDQEEKITIGGGRTENVAKDESITIGASRTENVGDDETISIGGNRTENVSKDETITISANRSENVSKDESVSIGANRNHSVGDNDSLSVGKTLSASAGDEIALSTGSASIVMKKNGDITINGKTITIKGSGDVIIKGKKILQN